MAASMHVLTVHIGICDGNVHPVRGKQHNGLWLAGNEEWAALNNGAYWDQINKGYSFRWNWRNGEEEMRAYLSKDSENDFSITLTWTYRKLLDNHILDDVKYHNRFFNLSRHTCISKCVQRGNRSESCLHNTSPVLQCTHIQFHQIRIQQPSHINHADSEYTN